MHAYLRTSPPHVRKIATKPARSAALSKATVSTKAVVKASKSAKGKSEKPKQKEEADVPVDEDDDMGSSFLQFW